MHVAHIITHKRLEEDIWCIFLPQGFVAACFLPEYCVCVHAQEPISVQGFKLVIKLITAY